MGMNILGREKSTYKGPKAEASRVRADSASSPRAPSALLRMESPAPSRRFSTEETLGECYCLQAGLPE